MAVKNIKIKSVVVEMPKISIKRGKKENDKHKKGQEESLRKA